MFEATTAPAIPAARRHRRTDQLAVSTYDRAASMLIALIVLASFFVLLLFLLWLTNRAFRRPESYTTVTAGLSGHSDQAFGAGHELEPPGAEELADLKTPELSDTFEDVQKAITSQMATLDILDDATDLSGPGRGPGDNRPLGPGDERSPDVIPRSQRWEVRFAGTRLELYAKQLDHFGIELAAVGQSGTVDYAFALSKNTPNRKSGKAEAEKRMYMTWRGGKLKEADRTLLSMAGISTNDRITMQFYPVSTERKLATTELLYADGRTIEEIRKTVFGVRSVGAGYEFHVINQEYR